MPAKVISIVMAKGGVGKSVTAVNLSAALSLNSKKVLLVDCDPQRGNATLSLGQTPSKLKFTLANVISIFLDLEQIEDIENTIIPITSNYHLLPANPKLETIQNRLIIENASTGILGEAGNTPAHSVLKHILSILKNKYDYIVIDCPPSVSMLTINALVASDSVLLPVEAHYESYEALWQILDVIKRIKTNWNTNLAIEGVLITKYQSRTNLCREVNGFIHDNYSDKAFIFQNSIPMSIKAAESTGAGLSIFDYAPDSDIAKAYENIAREVVKNG